MSTPANAINVTTAGATCFDGTGSFTGRTITGTTNQINVTNGNGASGNPTLSLPSTIDPGGISFDSGSNTLSSYRVTSWTPTLLGSGTAGTPTYTTHTGGYIKVGAMVFLNFTITASLSGSTGNFTIGGLPFASNANGPWYGYVGVNGLTWTAGYTYWVTEILASSSVITPLLCGSSVAATALAVVTATTVKFNGSIIYFTDS